MAVDARDYALWRDNLLSLLLAVVQILFGLILPAIQSVRETARRN